MGVVIGVDIGQRVDPTAIAVAEYENRAPPPTPARIIVSGKRMTEQPAVYPKDEYHFLIRHLERLPLGTPYPQVAERVAAVARGVRERGSSTPRTYVDATGVGTPVVDLLRAAGVPQIRAVYFTHGDRRVVKEDYSISLGKAWLVSRMQALLQGERLHLPGTPEAQALAKELLDYEIRVDANANDTYGAFKVGTHDDLVTALGLAVQEVPRQLRVL